MRNFTLKSLLIVVALAAIAVAASVWGFDAYRQYTFRKGIESAWIEAPVSSKPTKIESENSITIYFHGDELAASASDAKVDFRKCDTGGDYRYDLDCSLGRFRIIFYGNCYNELTSRASPDARPFDVLRDSLMLDNGARAVTAPLWSIRSEFMPVGCNKRLQHFETPRKMGFISGAIRPNTLMFLFDSSGEYSIGILPRDNTPPDWHGLAGRLLLEQRPMNGG